MTSVITNPIMIFQEMPLWSSCYNMKGCREIVGSEENSIATNFVLDKEYALDSVVTRVLDENKFLKIDSERLLAILDNIYLNRTEKSDLRYLKSKANRMKEQLDSTFTELFIQTLIQTLETRHGPRKPRRRLRGRMNEDARGLSEIDFLPDLQKWDNFYSDLDIDPLKQTLKSMPKKCTLLSLRAGILEKKHSLDLLKTFMDEFENVVVVVFSKPFDHVTQKMLDHISDQLSTDRLLFQAEGFFQMDLDNKSRTRVKRPGPLKESGANSLSFCNFLRLAPLILLKHF